MESSEHKQNYTKWRNATLSSKVEYDKKYMVLSLGSHVIDTAGLGWYIVYTLLGIRTAVANGYIPVVNWQNRKFPQYKYESSGMKNIWEYYFEQPCGTNLDEAYRTDDCCMIDNAALLKDYGGLSVGSFVDFNSNNSRSWRYYFQKYVRLKSDLKNEFDILAGEVLHGKRILGILYRGTDYLDLRPSHHPKAIRLEEIFQEADRLLEKGLFNGIFVATEDESILDKFKGRYKEKLCYAKAPRYSDVGRNSLNRIHVGEDNGRYRDKQYLFSLYVLAQCEGVIYTPCGGSVLSSLMKREEGSYFHFHYQGDYDQTCYIIGSALEEAKDAIFYVGGKPMLYYALNTMRLLSIKNITLIMSKSMIQKYQELLQDGQEYGLMIRYLDHKDKSDVITVLMDDMAHFKGESICIMREDNIFHGNACIQELYGKAKEFDGAYVWGIRKKISSGNEICCLNQSTKMPEYVSYSDDFSDNCRSIVGLYFFDYEFSEILLQLSAIKEKVTLSDIENVYIEKKKLIYSELKRGLVWAQIESEKTLEQVSVCIDLLEEQFGLRIGDIERKK